MSTPPSCRIALDSRIATCVAVGPGLVWYIPEPLRFVPASAVRFREPVHLAAGETMWMLVSWPPTAVGVYAADGRQRAEYRLDVDGTLTAHAGSNDTSTISVANGRRREAPEPCVTSSGGQIHSMREGEQDWDEKAETAKKAWELGRRTMVPKPLRPIPGSRLTLRRAFPQTD